MASVGPKPLSTERFDKLRDELSPAFLGIEKLHGQSCSREMNLRKPGIFGLRKMALPDTNRSVAGCHATKASISWRRTRPSLIGTLKFTERETNPELRLPVPLVNVESHHQLVNLIIMKQTKPSLQTSLFICTLIISMSGLKELRAQDQITLNNNSGNPIALLVDGKLNGSFVDDKPYVSSSSPALIGQFSKMNGNKTNEIMAFTQDRPMAIYANVPWTTGNDNIMVPFANKISIPVTIWVVYGDFASVCTKAANDILTASAIYSTERVGVDFSTVTFMNATAYPLAPNYYNHNNSTMPTRIKSDIGYVNGQINIYYVRSIIGQGGVELTQAACVDQIGGTMVFVGSTVIMTVLSHEIGHICSLQHVHSGLATQWFDFSNVMSQNGSPNARYLTEGQVLRMHLTSTSALNDTYNARPGKLIRNCAATSTTSTNTCPAVQKRIWADGIFPAN